MTEQQLTVSVYPSVLRITAPNASPKTLEGTHTYLVGADPCYVIDPGPDLEEYQVEVAALVSKTNRRCEGILLTHGHPDHAPGAVLLAEMLAVPIHASAELDASYFGVPPLFLPFSTLEEFAIEGDAIVAIAAPGHSVDHVVFWLPRARILFSGDVILGRGSTLVAPPEGNMSDYMKTLGRVRALDSRSISPGHGPLIDDPQAKIDEYIEHRRQREMQIIEALTAGGGTIEDLVARLYADLDPQLRPLAAGSVEAQLDKLICEGRVQKEVESFHLVSSVTVCYVHE